MRKTLFVLLALSCLTMPLIADPPKKQPKNPNWLNDQNDQTDTYAIPSDSSEEEEKEEMDELQQKPSTKQKSN